MKEVKESSFAENLMLYVGNLMDLKKVISMFSNASGCFDQYAKLIIFLYWQQTSTDNTYEIHRNKPAKDMRHLCTENCRGGVFVDVLFCFV